MTQNALLQCGLYLAVLTALAVPLGHYMARVYGGEARLARRALGFLEDGVYRLGGVRPDEQMSWRQYAAALLLLNLLGTLAVYGLARLQEAFPLNPAGLASVSPVVSFNTAVSFATNTNWQAYSGETTMSHLTQMMGLTVQGFLSAATGVAVLLVLVRGFSRRESQGVGNAWVDLTRTTVYVLLPIAIVLALALVSEGVVQTLDARATASLLDAHAGGTLHQTIALGPAASQIAIKQIGTNGGGFFGVNAAHPFENPTPLSGFLELVAIPLIPAALCFTFGQVVFGGVGSGLCGMLICAIVAVFIAGLMVGRTPELLGKKIEAYEIKMAALAVILPAATTLVGTAIACVVPEGASGVVGDGPHAFSQILYAFSSGAFNNGSAFASIPAASPFYAIAIAVCMLIGRYWVIVPDRGEQRADRRGDEAHEKRRENREGHR